MWQHIASTNPMARKDYKCEQCNNAIHKGTVYRCIVGTYDGDMMTYRQHMECWKAAFAVNQRQGNAPDEGVLLSDKDTLEDEDIQLLKTKHKACYRRLAWA